MDLLLKRLWLLRECVISELYIDDIFECYILEDPPSDSGIKISGKTCIPFGLNYKIARVYSPHFKMEVPVIYTDIIREGNSPDDFIIKDHLNQNWSATEMHPGNKAADTLACQLPGQSKNLKKQRVYDSVKAFKILKKKIFFALDQGEEVTYMIVNSTPDQAHDYKSVA